MDIILFFPVGCVQHLAIMFPRGQRGLKHPLTFHAETSHLVANVALKLSV